MKCSDLVALAGVASCLYVGLVYCHDSAILGMEEELRQVVRQSARMAQSDGMALKQSYLRSELLSDDDHLVYAESIHSSASTHAAIQANGDWY